MDRRRIVPPPLPPDVREDIRALIAAEGEAAAISALGVSRPSLARALAGLGVRAGTAELIRSRLPKSRVA